MLLKNISPVIADVNSMTLEGKQYILALLVGEQGVLDLHSGYEGWFSEGTSFPAPRSRERLNR